MATKRKDSNRIVLKKGEYQRTNGTYAFRWTDENGKRHEVYAKDLDDLRAKESEIEIDTTEGLKAEARYTIINEMFDLWEELKRGLKDNTFENYKYMYNTLQFCYLILPATHSDIHSLLVCAKLGSMSKSFRILWDIRIYQLL